KAKVPVSNNGGANAIAVAEHTVLLMLAVLKQLVRFHQDVVAGKWRPPASSESPVYELSARTVGIIGLGNIGKKVGRRAAACRGPVVDENALYEALKGKRLAGAGLDVLVEEPPAKNHPLFTLPNVTLTPHSAGPTWENWTARFRNGFDNIERVAAGRKPLWVIPELA